jgi:hypothetical protein
MCKEDTNFGVRWLVLVGNGGRLPSIWQARSIMLEFPLQWPVLDRIWVHIDWVLLKTFSLECEKRGYHLWNPVVGLVSWLSRIQHLLSYILYLSRNVCFVMVITRSNIGWYRFGSCGRSSIWCMCKEDNNFGISWLVLVENRGRLPSIRLLARTIMLEFPMQGLVLDGIWVLTD